MRAETGAKSNEFDLDPNPGHDYDHNHNPDNIDDIDDNIDHVGRRSSIRHDVWKFASQ